MKDRNGGKAGKSFAPPLGVLPPIENENDETVTGFSAKGKQGMVSRATRARMDPDNPAHRANIGMANVLKKARLPQAHSNALSA